MSTTHTGAAFGLRDRDGLAVIGRTLHDLRGIRYNQEPGGNAPAATEPPPAFNVDDILAANGQPPAGAPAAPPATFIAPPAAPAAPVVPGNGVPVTATPSAPAPAAPQAPVTPPAAPAAPEGLPDNAPEWLKDPSKLDPVKAWKLFENLRTDLEEAKTKKDEAANTAAEQAKQSLTDQLAQALGLKPKDAPADPQEVISSITQERDAARQQLREFTQREAIRAAADAPEVGAEIALLLPILNGNPAFTALDPTATDYAVQVTALAKATVDQFPQIRKVQVAPRSGNGEVPYTGNLPSQEPTSVDEWRAEIGKETRGA